MAGIAVRTWLAPDPKAADKSALKQKTHALDAVMAFDLDEIHNPTQVFANAHSLSFSEGHNGYVGELGKHKEEQPQTSGRPFAWIGNHRLFARFVQTMIILNSLQMGLEVVFEDPDVDIVWMVLEQYFTVFFFLEVLIRVYCDGWKYVTDPHDRPWNALDVLVVTISVVDAWILTPIGSSGGSITVLKILRLARLLRVLKLLREYKALMLLIESIIGSLKPMAWLAVMLSILIYAFSILCVHAIGRSGAYPEGRGPLDNEEYPTGTENLELLFGDLGIALFTLSGLALGHRAKFILKSLFSFQPYLLPLMYAYMGIVMFGLLNAMIGIVCQKTKEACQETERLEEVEKQCAQKDVVDKLKDIMYTLDKDGDGTVSTAELKKAGKNPVFTVMLGQVDLPSSFRLEDVHLMLDKDGDGELTEAEFADGMYDMISGNNFQRQCIMMRSVAQGKRALCEFREEIAREFQSLRESIGIRVDSESQSEPGPASPISHKAPPVMFKESNRSPATFKDAVCEEPNCSPAMFEAVKGTWEALSSDVIVEAVNVPTFVGQPVADIVAETEGPSKFMEREPKCSQPAGSFAGRQVCHSQSGSLVTVEDPKEQASTSMVDRVPAPEKPARVAAVSKPVLDEQVDNGLGTTLAAAADSNPHIESALVKPMPTKKVANTRVSAMQMAAAKYGGRPKSVDSCGNQSRGSRPPTRKQIAAARLEASQVETDDMHVADFGDSTDMGSDNDETVNSIHGRHATPARVLH